ncbi:MAG: restriction endonuclease subunit S [Bacteroidetes bacterium]|nr:restriction endonuclease subunit S [Bacteroidota bacterium]
MSSSLPTVDLRPDHWEIIREILQRQLPSKHVFAFGSRATWTAKDYSDLDLAIMGEQPLSLSVLSALNEDFIESDLPFSVDIVDFASVDDSFRAIIQHHGVSVQSPLDVISSTTHISKEELRTIRRLVEKHLPNTDAWVYGDRLKEEPNRRSDLNIVVFSTPEQQQRVSDLREAFDESDLSLRVNLLVSEEGAEGVHKEIKRGYFVIVNGEQKRKSTNWQEVSIGEIADIIGGGTPSTKDPENFNGSVPWLTPKDLSGTHERYIRRGKRNLSQKGLESSSAKLLPENSVLLSTRAPIGYVALAKNPIATNQGFRNLIARDDVTPEFLYYWLKSNTQELERHSSGSVFQELSGSALRDISIKLAPLTEQRSITQILGSLDDKIELNRRMNATLEAMARALFKSWFVDFEPVRAKMEGRDTALPKHIADMFPNQLVESELGMLPEGWRIKPLDAIAWFQNGLALQKHRPRNGQARLPVVKIAQLRTGRVDSKEWASADIKPGCILNNGDIVFSWSGSLLVRFWCGGPAALNQHLFKVTSNKFPKWFYWHCVLIHLENFQRIAQGKAKTMGHIRRHHLDEALCAVPPDSVINSITHIFDTLLKNQIANEIESHTLVTLRDILLPKLISGKFRIT